MQRRSERRIVLGEAGEVDCESKERLHERSIGLLRQAMAGEGDVLESCLTLRVDSVASWE